MFPGNLNFKGLKFTIKIYRWMKLIEQIEKMGNSNYIIHSKNLGHERSNMAELSYFILLRTKNKTIWAKKSNASGRPH